MGFFNKCLTYCNIEDFELEFIKIYAKWHNLNSLFKASLQ